MPISPAPCQPKQPATPSTPDPAPGKNPCHKEMEPANNACSPAPTITISGTCIVAVGAFVPGTCYVLLNARGGTAMDLSGVDNTSLIGYPMHGGPNQQWDFITFGLGYAIRCVRPDKDGNALYLTINCGGVRNGTLVVAGTHPVAWHVEQIKEGIIISWPNSNYVFDLSNWGDKTPNTKIQLMPRLPGEFCQVWHLDARGPAPDVFAAAVSVSSTCAVESFAAGNYHVLLNAHGGTAVDINGANDAGVVGNAMHGEDSQQWEMAWFGLGYSIRCARASAEGHARYLTVDGSGPCEGASIVAGTHPVAWDVERVEAGVRISWPNSKYVFHLAKEGAQAACKAIQLMPLVPGELCQLWRATQVTAACK